MNLITLYNSIKKCKIRNPSFLCLNSNFVCDHTVKVSQYVMTDMLRGVAPIARKCAKFRRQETYFGSKYVLSDKTLF